MNLPTFLRIIRQSPSIQSLALGGQWSDFHPEIWTELSALCPHLRELDIKFYGAIKDFPTMATLVTLFPRLESVLLIRQLFSKDPDFSTLDATLQRHKQLYGTPHPFKSLEITGTIRQQFPIIMDALTLPVALESFKIGNIIRHSRFLQTDPLPTPPISLARMLELTSTNASPWPCHASLTTLDISSAIFPNYASTFHFFGLLQEFTRLRTLHFWLFHLRDMICHVDSVKNPSEEDAASPLETTDGNSGDNSTPLVDVSDINNNNINGSNNPSDSNTGDNNTNDNNTVDNNTSDNSASDNNTNDNSISESNNNSISLITSNAILINSNFSSSSISLESISTSSSTNSNSNSSSSLNPSSSGNTRVQSLTLNFPTLRKVHVAPVFEMVRSGLGPAITIHEARLLIEAMPFMVQFDLSSCAGVSRTEDSALEYDV
ncbi:hypothetical protein BGX24_011232 [Mortierella sp. AD032]|nr:hypothetical protein BGX24_011232 [Mortierella sp. AD032]